MKQQSKRLPHIRIYYQLHIDGKAKTRRRICHSWLKAFAQCLFVQFTNTYQSVKHTSGSNATIDPTNNQFQALGPVDTDTRGIQVGTDNTDETFADYALLAKIATGNSTGQLRYLAQTTNGPTIDSTSLTFQLIRSFVNNSGASITVREIGIVGLIGSGNYYGLLARDNLGSEQVIGSGQTLTVTYTITVSI